MGKFLDKFWKGERIFWREFGTFIENSFFILVNHGVSGGVSIQMLISETFDCLIWR